MTYKFIIDRLLNNNFESYIVGGYVRDKLLGIKSHDVDIVTNASYEEIVDLFKEQRVKIFGKLFKVVTINDIEVATYRIDNFNNIDFNILIDKINEYNYTEYSELLNRDNNVMVSTAKTLTEDLYRRDITINAMALDNNNNIIDIMNSKEDINNRIIKFVGDPEICIFRDILRILRAIRFRCLLNGTYDNNTYNAIKKYSYLIKLISMERINIELMKVLKTCKDVKLYFYDLYEFGILEYILPSLYNLYNLDGGKHHNETVFEHVILSCNNISIKYPILRFTALLHDIGKYYAQNIIDDNITFYHHESMGLDILRDELYRLKFSNDHVDYILTLIRTHMYPVTESKKSTRKLLEELYKYKIPYTCWCLLSYADKLGNTKKTLVNNNFLKKLINKIEHVILLPSSINKINSLKINGNDVKTLLNLEQGIIIGTILKCIYEMVQDEIIINDRDILLNYLENNKSELIKL